MDFMYIDSHGSLTLESSFRQRGVIMKSISAWCMYLLVKPLFYVFMNLINCSYYSRVVLIYFKLPKSVVGGYYSSEHDSSYHVTLSTQTCVMSKRVYPSFWLIHTYIHTHSHTHRNILGPLSPKGMYKGHERESLEMRHCYVC